MMTLWVAANAVGKKELSAQYPWVKNYLLSTPGSRPLCSVPLGQELSGQYPWVKNSLLSTPGSRTLCSVPLGQELSAQYPWVKNFLLSLSECLFFFD